MSTEHLERSNAAILTCESWMAQGAYIVFPINPQQLSFDLGVRTSNELTRACQVVYVWRYMNTMSKITKPTIKITANSGYMAPSFDPSVISQCHEMMAGRSLNTRTARAAGVADLDAGSAISREQFDQYESDIALARTSYVEQLAKFQAHTPAPEDMKDYISGGVYKQVGLALKPSHDITDTGLTGAGNLPDLYTENNKTVPIGIQNLYALFSLADERRIRKTSEGASSQTENRLMLILSTMVFPRLVLHGWLGESGIAYTASAEDPHSFDVNFDFVVTDTTPSLSYNNWNALIDNYRTGMQDQGTTLDFARAQWPSGTPAQTPRR